MASGSWLVIEELLERGDPTFVESLRACDDGQRLAAFAAAWHADRRPAARRFLLEYFQRPLNAYHHEGLVKRLFKLAEKAGDDEAMAHFMVLFDRSIRRKQSKTSRFRSANHSTQSAAQDQERQWIADGAETTGVSGSGRQFYVWARWPGDRLVMPRGSTMPRELTGVTRILRLWGRSPRSVQDLPEDARQKLEKKRLFSVHTRNYLRRRTWRYFRNLAKTAPERYVGAVVIALKLYEDADVQDGLAFLDNWGLIHILFHDSTALWPRSHGWTLRPGRALSELTPAPAIAHLWRQQSQAILELLQFARCRPVRQWAVFFLRQDPTLLEHASVEVLFELLQSVQPEVVALAAAALEKRPGLEDIVAERWLRLLEKAPPSALDAVCALVAAQFKSERLTLEQLVTLTCRRPLPVARLGFRWLQARSLSEQDWPALLRLTEAEAVSLRPDLVSWARGILARASEFQPQWVLNYLDNRHEDVRGEGWAWLLEDRRAHDDVQLWQRLFESPYDDIRLKLIAYLETRYARHAPALARQVPLDPDLVRHVWATVLLNIHRGNRSKPRVVQQIVRRLTERPEDAPRLLPIVKVALRSIRGPEWRAGLSGIVQLLDRQPELEKIVGQSFPELQLVSGGG